MPEIDLSWLEIDPWLIATVIVGIVAFLAVTIVWGIRAHHLKVTAGREDLIGKTAEVKVVLEPKGIVFVEGERWTAVSESGRVEPGEEVTITKLNGLKLYVTKKE